MRREKAAQAAMDLMNLLGGIDEGDDSEDEEEAITHKVADKVEVTKTKENTIEKVTFWKPQLPL